jgi:hypothetical protein
VDYNKNDKQPLDRCVRKQEVAMKKSTTAAKIASGLNLVCIIAFSLSSAWGATYYVSPPPQGNDANSGTQTSDPWATIQKAANAMVAGDTVTVASGTYDERIVTVRDGSSGNFITFQAEGLVQMKGFMIYHDYIIVDGFDISGSPALMNQGAIQIMIVASHGQILNNSIHDLAANIYGILFYRGGRSPEQSSDHFLVRGNAIRNINAHGITLYGFGHLVVNNMFNNMGGSDAMRIFGRDHVIRNNIFENISIVEGVGNHPDIFQTFGNNLDWSYNVLFENNIIRHCQCQIMMSSLDTNDVNIMGKWTFRNNLFYDISNPAIVCIPEVKFYNNTFYRCAYTMGMVIAYRVSEGRAGQDGEVMNNLFIECGEPSDPNGTKGWYWAEDTVTGFHADSNFVVGPASQGYPSKATFSEPHGINGGDPGFFSRNDFHLKAGSPLIDSGTAIPGMPALDFSGNEGLALGIGGLLSINGTMKAWPLLKTCE